MLSLEERRHVYPAPQEQDAPDIRGLITEFSLVTPAGTDLEDLALIFRTDYPVIDRLRRAFPKITLAERVVFARFALHYADPALAPNFRAAEACEDLIWAATDTMVMLGLAERETLIAHLGGQTAIDQLGAAMANGQPLELGLWLSYVVLRDLTDTLGENHGLIKLARTIVDSRDPRAAT